MDELRRQGVQKVRPSGEDHAVSAEALAFGERREPALLPAFVLAALVHLFSRGR